MLRELEFENALMLHDALQIMYASSYDSIIALNETRYNENKREERKAATIIANATKNYSQSTIKNK